MADGLAVSALAADCSESRPQSLPGASLAVSELATNLRLQFESVATMYTVIFKLGDLATDPIQARGDMLGDGGERRAKGGADRPAPRPLAVSAAA